MLKFTGYVPKEPDKFDGFFKVGISVSEYLEQSKLNSLMDPQEKLIGQTIQINEDPYKVHSWEFDNGCFIVSVKPESSTPASPS